MIVHGSYTYTVTVDDEGGGQFRWRVVRMAGAVGPGTHLDEGIESSRKEAERKGNASLQKIIADLQGGDKR